MFSEIQSDSLAKFYEVTISVSGILFPVFQAVLFFIIEKSFNRLEFSRQILVEFYNKAGKVITLNLVYLLLQSLLQIIHFNTFSFWFLYVFSILAAVFRFDLLKYTAYLNTLNSSHYTPQKANILKKIVIILWNNTFPEKINFLIFAIIIILPFTQNFSVFWSVFTILVYTLFQISILFNNPTFIQKKLLQSENTNHELINENLKWEKQKIDFELQIIENTLTSNGYKIQEYLTNKNFNYWLNPQTRENGELFVAIMIKDLKINSIEELKKQIYVLTKTFFVLFCETATDINSFVLSFNLVLDGKSKNLLVRSNKNEILDIKNKEPEEFVNSLKNKSIDDILK